MSEELVKASEPTPEERAQFQIEEAMSAEDLARHYPDESTRPAPKHYGDGRRFRATVREATCIKTQHAYDNAYEGFGRTAEEARKHLADAIFR